MKIYNLYEKVELFDNQVSKKTQTLSQCKKGCSRCCYVDLSVFTIEAQNILKWFQSKSIEEQKELKNKWNSSQKMTLSFNGDQVKSCVFLNNEECSIYEVRPLICRTQGMALAFKEKEQDFLDICPLNKEMLNVIKSQEVLNLDLLNVILSTMQNEQMQSSDRISLKDLVKQLTEL